MGNPWAYDFSAVGRGTAPLLIVTGADGEAKGTERGGFSAGGNSDIYKLLADSCRFDELNLCRQFRNQPDRPNPSHYSCILNLVTDPDQHPRTLETLRKLLRGHRGRVINHPDAVLKSSRHQVARRLAGIDRLRVPKVLRLRNPAPGGASRAAERAGLSFPVIARMAGTHTGRIIGLVEDPAQLDQACAGRGDFLVTEFVDFKSADQVYRKYRVFFIGGQRIFRHLIAANGWNIHARERFAFMAHHPAIIAEELDIIEQPSGRFPEAVDAALQAVRERTPLDFFGMDFAIGADGKAVLFEANATMSFFPVVDTPPFEHIARVIEPARDAMARLMDPQATTSSRTEISSSPAAG